MRTFAALAALLAAAAPAQIFDQKNLMAWCIVPFDASNRGPVERAAMLKKLGITKFAYDWREKDIPTFDQELDALQAAGLTIDAFWFPVGMNPATEKNPRIILDFLKRRGLKSELWLSVNLPKDFASLPQDEKVAAVAKPVGWAAAEAARIGAKVGLYNHGGWYGEPENQIAVIQKVGASNLGIVYNFHHGHDHVARFAELFRKMQPYLLAVNLNGMKIGGPKILTIGEGDRESEMLRVISASGYRGPIGILNHRTDVDAETGLRGNMEGLRKLTGVGEWTSLFDGATLKGWRVAAKPEDAAKEYWTVRDGAITCDSRGRAQHDYVWLMSAREYGDFDLKLKVRSFKESNGNSGVQIRSRYDAETFWLDGPQIDIHPPGPFRTGLIYDETRGVKHWIAPVLPDWKIAPEQGVRNPVWRHADEGDGWNDLLIEARGPRIRTTVNGVQAADFDGAGVLDDDLHRRRNAGLRGFIALQLHARDDLHIQFKDIFVRPAPDPQPPVVDPGASVRAPSDAVVLFDGKDLSEWSTADGRLTGWTVQDGAILTTAERPDPSTQKRSFDLLSKRKFGSAQIHLEYNIPPMPSASGQARGNSGVYLQGRYEIQVLDSVNNPTYPHGSNAALYGWFPPLVNASRPPGEWQSYDIVFHAPRCDPQGKLAEPGRLTLLHNGVLVHDHAPVVPRKGCNAAYGPLLLQDHYHPAVTQTPMRFRNIWVRPLP